MKQQTVFLTMIGMFLVTYLPRVLPLWLFSSRPLPPLIVAWLRYVPAAVLSAMLLPSLLFQEGELTLSANNLFLWASIPTFVIAWRTRSLIWPVVVGMVTVAGVRLFLNVG